MHIPGLKRVSHESSVIEIIHAITLAGAFISAVNPHYRRYDIPIKEHKKFLTYEGFSWVKPGDIGRTRRDDTKLLERLQKLCEEGVLEMLRNGNLPRFRVTRKHLVAVSKYRL